MQRDDKTAETPSDQTGQPKHGPRPIDPSDFKHIGGGAPRGGWTSDGAVPPAPSAPDGSAPRGGW